MAALWSVLAFQSGLALLHSSMSRRYGVATLYQVKLPFVVIKFAPQGDRTGIRDDVEVLHP